MNPTLAFPDNHKAAIAARDFGVSASGQLHGLTLLPYSFLSPEYTVWWLVPGPRPFNPAYRHGKGFISQLKVGPGAGGAYAGFYVEKGFAQAEAKALQLPLVQLMDSTWCWHSVMASARAGELDQPSELMSAASKAPAIVTVAAGEPNRSREQQGASEPADQVVYEAGSAGALRLESGGRIVLAPLDKCATLRELFAGIAALDALRFYWLDFIVGVRLEYGPPGPGAWGGAELWQRAMAPWAKWLN